MQAPKIPSEIKLLTQQQKEFVDQYMNLKWMKKFAMEHGGGAAGFNVFCAAAKANNFDCGSKDSKLAFATYMNSEKVGGQNLLESAMRAIINETGQFQQYGMQRNIMRGKRLQEKIPPQQVSRRCLFELTDPQINYVAKLADVDVRGLTRRQKCAALSASDWVTKNIGEAWGRGGTIMMEPYTGKKPTFKQYIQQFVKPSPKGTLSSIEDYENKLRQQTVPPTAPANPDLDEYFTTPRNWRQF